MKLLGQIEDYQEFIFGDQRCIPTHPSLEKENYIQSQSAPEYYGRQKT